jgi:hypothetical protein
MVDVLDPLLDPENTPEADRAALRAAAEDEAFDPARYRFIRSGGLKALAHGSYGCRYVGDEYFGTAEDPLYIAAFEFSPHWKATDYILPPKVTELPGERGDDGASAKVTELPGERGDDGASAKASNPAKDSSCDPKPAKAEFSWTVDESNQLQRMASREYLLDSSEMMSSWSELVSILIGYKHRPMFLLVLESRHPCHRNPCILGTLMTIA